MGNRSTNQSPLSAALYLLEAGLIAAGIVLLEALSAFAEIPVELAPRVMLSAGLSAGLVLALGVRALPGILAGAVAAGFLYYKGGVPAALVFTVAMLLQAQLIGLFAGRLGLGAYAEAPSGESGRGATSEVFDLVALAVLGACVLPTLQAVFDCASGAQPWASFSRLWWADWIGSALGVMMLAPPVMHVVGYWRTGAGLGNALVPLSVAVLSLGPAGYLLHSAAELQRELAPTAGLRLQWVQDGISWLVLCAFIGLGLLLAWLARQQQRAMQVQQVAAEALRQSEARFRSLTALSSDFYWETDEDSRFTHHEARATLAQLGGDVMGRRRWELAGATAISASWELHQSVLNQRKSFRDFEWMGLGQDGKAYYNRVSGEPVFDALGRFTGYRGVATDISEAYRLRRAQDLSDRMTNNSPAFILALDAAGRIQAMNRAMLEAVGYREAAVLGRNYLDLFVPEREHGALRATMQGMLERHKSTIDESSLLTSDGRRLTVQWHLSAVLDEQGRFEQLCAIGLDLSERKRTEQMLREAQKLEAIGQLTGGLAHDFNNLLGVVVGNLDFLGDKLPGDKHQKAALDAALRGAEVTRSLLAVARRQPMEVAGHDLNELLGEMVPLLRSSAGSSVTLVPALSEGSLVARLDAGGLSNVVLNLVINARDAMREMGRERVLTVRTLREDQAEGNALGLTAGGYAVLEVEDTGSGMSEEVRAQAFEPFFTTKERGKGTGLGLAMVYGYAEQLGGTARIESEPGVGTKVRVYLPLEAAGVERVEVEVAAEAGPAGGPPVAMEQKRWRVLVVDDEVGLSELACVWLGSLGYEAEGVNSPAHALDKLKAGTYDVLFTDVVMPGGMDGIALAREARALQPGLRILLASGYAQALLGADDLPGALLNKPYRKGDLAKRFAELRSG